MGAEAARVLDYTGSGYYGSAAPARAPFAEPVEKPVDIPVPHEQTHPKENVREAGARNAPSLSLFAVCGTIFASVLMVFVVLAQISYSEIAGETVRLSAQMDELIEREKRLEIAFENSIDMKKIETVARDTLGMSKPDTDHAAIILSMPIDSAEIITGGGSRDGLTGFGSFISSLLEYFR